MKTFLFITTLLFSIITNAQAYDSQDDNKIFIGYANVGGIFAAEIEYDKGIGDLVSYGGKIIFLINPNKNKPLDEFEEGRNVLASFDFGSFLRFHLGEPLKMNEKFDPFLGLDASFSSIGIHSGIKYSFSETLGLYIRYNQSFSGSISGNNNAKSYDENSFYNYFAKQGTISGGLTIYL